MPPAFALSQDQTLKFIRSNTSSPALHEEPGLPCQNSGNTRSSLAHENRTLPRPPLTLSHHPDVALSPGPPAANPPQTNTPRSARTPATHPSPAPQHPGTTAQTPPPQFKHAPAPSLSRPASPPPDQPRSHSSHPATSCQITQAKHPGFLQ